jgi:ectoine hydrolase
MKEHNTGHAAADDLKKPGSLYTSDTGVALDFELSEYENRLEKTQAKMAEHGMELLIITDPANMNWLTGYDGWSFYVPQCVLVPIEDKPLWFGREMDANGAKITSWLPFSRLNGYPDHYVQSTTVHPMDYLADIIKSWGWGSRTIGMEMDNYYFSARCHRSLEFHLPNAKLGDVTGMVNWLRAVKSPQEIKYMRKAGQIVEAMHKHVFEIIKPGITKKDLAAALSYTGIMGIDDEGGDYPAIVPLISTGREASAPHLTWDNTRIEENDVTFFEIAGCFKRYHCPLARSIYLGKPPQLILDAEKALIEATAKAFEKAMPGNRCEEFAQAFFHTLQDFGFDKSSRCGYSIGLGFPPDWGERTMSLRAGDSTELVPGMTFHFMPGLWYDDWGLEITESIIITDNGVECLANLPRELFVKQ